MNCKPGDLAIVIRDDEAVLRGFPGVAAVAHIAGRIVTVVELQHQHDEPAWRIEVPLIAKFSGALSGYGAVDVLPDAILRPLPPLADDELEHAGKPEQVAA